jgi:hypothetical protein
MALSLVSSLIRGKQIHAPFLFLIRSISPVVYWYGIVIDVFLWFSVKHDIILFGISCMCGYVEEELNDLQSNLMLIDQSYWIYATR